MNQNIMWFALGVLFYMFIVPILDQLCSLICLKMEEKKGEYNLKIVEYNSKADKIVKELEKPYEVSHAIGFEVPTYDEYYDDYEEDD